MKENFSFRFWSWAEKKTYEGWNESTMPEHIQSKEFYLVDMIEISFFGFLVVITLPFMKIGSWLNKKMLVTSCSETDEKEK
jgi:hypothetical protein